MTVKSWAEELFAQLETAGKPQMFLVNAFVDVAEDGSKSSLCFSGNPAAVCLSSDMIADKDMQGIAMEMNQAETAFLTNTTAHGGDVLLRWFTPTREIELCGHATMGAVAAVLDFLQSGGSAGAEPGTALRLGTLHSGVLEVVQKSAGSAAPQPKGVACLEMNFPSTPVSPAEGPAGLLESLGLAGGKGVVAVGKSIYDYVVEVESEAILLDMAPDFASLAKVEARGVLVTCRHTSGKFNRPGCAVSFLSRGFFPAAGINEDPVTGSAHCALTPYWAKKLGQTEMWAYQASRRGGLLRVTDAGDRVRMEGYAYVFMQGTANL